MKNPLTLIQLISEQTMQNLLPVLRLKPSRLIHLATPKTRSRSAWIAEAARQANCPVELETVPLSAMPGMKETMTATLAGIERAATANHSVLVNFTGGTKLMSIGAYVAALKHRVPSFYVDTQDSVFVDGQSTDGLSDAFAGDISFTPILHSLSVNAVAVANGCGRITHGHDWRPWLPLASHLHQHGDDEEACHRAINGSRDQPPAVGDLRKAAQWLGALHKDIPLPPQVAQLATTTGVLRAGSRPDTVRLPDSTRDELEELARLDGSGRIPGFLDRLFKAIAPLQLSLNFLGGAWWEVVVADRMKQCGRFRDIRWSVLIGEAGGPELEEDVVAMDGVQVAYISCKRSSRRAKFLPLLQQVDGRARSLGGTFTRRFLAICQKPSPGILRNLETRARELGVRLLFPADLERPDPFDQVYQQQGSSLSSG